MGPSPFLTISLSNTSNTIFISSWCRNRTAVCACQRIAARDTGKPLRRNVEIVAEGSLHALGFPAIFSLLPSKEKGTHTSVRPGVTHPWRGNGAPRAFGLSHVRPISFYSFEGERSDLQQCRESGGNFFRVAARFFPIFHVSSVCV